MRTMADLRRSMERGVSPPPRPQHQSRTIPSHAEAQVKGTDNRRKKTKPKAQPDPDLTDDEVDDEEDMDWDDGDTTDTGRSIRHHTDFGSALLQPRILLDGKRWGELTEFSWLEVKRVLLDQYSSAASHFSHDITFILDMLSSSFRAIQQNGSLLLPLARVLIEP